ncbi:hypothetical protein K501DRAFT_279597 [Backusella circina FSU 941]|nr:hypothetical protein K501DRAFT_279597 [Backusella circina FSU 941]
MPKLNIKPFILLPFLLSKLSAQSYDDIDIDEEDLEEDNDDCAFISGQHCDQNGICKYCAMCLQSSCILSKTILNNNALGTNSPVCNMTQFGTTDLYDWYDYCLSSGNDSIGNYCAASTECYQYRKNTGSSVTYAWNNLTCNPTTCMLIASNGAPPPTPVSPFGSSISIDKSTTDNNGSNEEMTQMVDGSGFRHVYYHNKAFRNPAAVALTVVCSLVFIVVSVWLIRLGKKKKWWSKFKDSSREKVTNSSVVKSWKHNNDQRSRRIEPMSFVNSISSIPSSAPPSFSSGPLDMSNVRHPHDRLNILQQNPFQSPRSSSSSTRMEPLPCYLSPDTSLPKYEQAIVTQIRGFRNDDSSPTSSDPMGQPSMWVPVYFSHFRRVSNHLPQNIYEFPGERLSPPIHSFWIQSPPNILGESSTSADITEETQ